MQYVYGLLEPGDVHHAVDAARIPEAHLSCPCTHIFERLPVGRLKPGLDLPQFETRFLPGASWERQQIIVSGPDPTDLSFIVHATGMYKILYVLRQPVKGAG